MSAPPHDGWPRVGDVFPHWSDLLLATQLAALREGYTAIGTYWDSKSSSKIWVTCQVELISQRTERCIHRLVRAALVDSSKPHESWIVEIVRNENLGVEQHPRHHGGIGRSKGFKSKPSKSPKLSKGKVFKNWESFHLLEAGLRASSRAEGRFITGFGRETPKKEFKYFFSCVLGPRCTFYLRFDPHKQGEDGAGWKCIDLCLQHSCHSVVPPVSDRMQEILSFWPPLKAKKDSMISVDRRNKVEKYFVSVRDEVIGSHPVLEVGSDGKPIYTILADAKLTARLETRRSAFSRASEALSTARQSLLNLQTNAAALELVGDLDEANVLRKGIRKAEKVVAKKEKKWARKSAKVERMKEKIETEKMKRRKLAGENVKSPKLKKDQKEKKERKKKDKA